MKFLSTKTIFISLILLLFITSSFSLSCEIYSDKHPANSDTLHFSTANAFEHAVMGSLAGVVFGGALGFGTAYILGSRPSETEPDGVGFALGILFGAYIGSPIGTATFLYYGSDKNCSFWHLLFFAAVPELTMGTIDLLSGRAADYPTLSIIGFILAPLGATIYYEFAKRNNNPNQSSFIEIKNSQIKFSFPELNINYNSMPSFSPNSKNGYSEYQINLIRIAF